MFAPGRPHARGLGDALDDAADGDDGGDPTLQQLRILAQQIVHQRQIANGILSSVSNADTVDVDWTALNQALQSIVNLKARFQQVAAQRTAENPYALSSYDNAILAIGDWATSVLEFLPNAIAAIPNAIIDGLAKVASNTGKDLLGAAVPFGLLAAAGVGLLLFAEKSRTVRKYT